jgi:tRNA threonylcarbamoyl adenosine modification protein (Sua5/YciO/YrdC/YwlC family)
MSQFLQIHPESPQPRLIAQAVQVIRKGGVVVYPTDSGYALGCHLGDKQSVNKIRRIRGLSEKHNFTLICRDLSELGTYAQVDNSAYRLLRSHTPGPYTFILKATSEVPKRLMQAKRRTIGLRVPDNAITQALLAHLDEPLMSVTMMLPGETLPLTDPYDIKQTLEHELDLIIDGGFCGMEPTSIIDLVEGTPEIIRRGQGDVSDFEAV